MEIRYCFTFSYGEVDFEQATLISSILNQRARAVSLVCVLRERGECQRGR